MVGLDASNPPVLFIVGTAGAGKSSLVTSFQRWSRFLETEVIAVNLDPGAERVHYDAEFDVRDLISLSEVMDEYDLGPNGAQRGKEVPLRETHARRREVSQESAHWL